MDAARPGFRRRVPYEVRPGRSAVVAADLADLHPIRIAGSTPVPCGMSRETVKRSELAGWAGYGYQA